jgi:hypothetical protein
VGAAAVPPKVLQQAEVSTGGILARAGVKVEWVDCALETCAGIPGLWLQIAERRPVGLHTEATGYAVVPYGRGTDGYAVVSWELVTIVAREMDLDAGPVLGAAMAHELGHLLLGQRAHAPGGVMAPRFRRRELEMAARGELAFTDAQARQIRALLSNL